LEVLDALIQYELTSSVTVVAEELAGSLRNGDLIPGKGETIFLSLYPQDCLSGPPSLLSSEYLDLFPSSWWHQCL